MSTTAVGVDYELILEGGIVRLALSIPDAAAVTGTSRDTLDAARASGKLTYRYPTTKPVVLVKDLLKYLENLPTERPKK